MKRKTYYYSSYTDDFGITENVKKTIVGDDYKYKNGYAHLASGLCCGLSSLGAGIAIGIGGDAGVRALGQTDKIFGE